MIKQLKKIFSLKKQKRDFSSFFNQASPKERHKVLQDVVRKANQDQRALINQYNQANQKSA